MLKRCLCIALALFLTAAGLAGCAPFSFATPRTATWMDVFDTITTLTVYGVDSDTFERQAEQLHRELLTYHRLFDIYHTYEGVNNLKTINDNPGQPVTVAEPILALLEFGLTAYERTGGGVNLLFGSVLTQWHACRQAALSSPEEAKLPDRAALQVAATHTDPASLRIDREAGTVCLTDPQSRLDVGAFAKGYAVERVAAFAADELGWASALLDVGGNIRAVGGKPALYKDIPFTIGVRNPDTDSARTYLLTLEVEDRSVVTSGDYQRYFLVDGVRYHHIIDPGTLQPATHHRSVTVVCKDSGLADVLSTALFILPLSEGQKLLDAYEDAEAVWVLADGTIQRSEDFERYL